MITSVNTRLYLAFAAISIMIVVATALAIFRLEGLWRVIDVTQRSIEQTAAYIIHLLEKHRSQAANTPEPQLPPPDKADGG